ncbi:MAG: hypothetical protein CMA09_01890 [Euryarchaeota archaeon]|nr:hypothetical protein [Euryarchaeota archaeon]
MDPRAPKIATAALVFGVISVLLSILSYLFNLGLADGFGLEEAVLLSVSGVLFLVWYIASRERPEMEMISSPTAEEQFEAIESMPTKFRSTSTEVDQFGFETNTQTSLQTKSIVESILGESKTIEASEIGNAYAALTSDPESIGSQQVKSNPAPHRHTVQNREVVKPSRDSQDSFQRTEVLNIPLPGQVEVRETPDQPWLSQGHEFQTSGINHIPLPVAEKPEIVPSAVELPPVEISEVVPSAVELPPVQIEASHAEVPKMPNLDDLFIDEPSQIQSNPRTTPALPNLDDLF